MLIKFIKRIAQYAGVSIIVCLISPLLLLFLAYRKYQQYRTSKNLNRRLRNGINILEPIDISGLQQWVTVRSENKENPLLLIIHGGPGMSMMPYSFIFDELESDFTIVQWDQRGAGKTYAANKKILSHDAMAIAKFQADTLEMVNYLRHRFNKEKIFVLGYSWGSSLGLKLAQDYPELLYAYIGVGQFVNTKINEKIGYDNALKIAYRKKSKKAIDALKKLSSFHDDNMTMRDVLALRKWQFKLNDMPLKKAAMLSLIVKALCVPEYSLLDYFSLVGGILSSLSQSNPLYDELINISLEDKTNFSTAICIFGGKLDFITPALPVYEYFKNIQGPYKKYVWFKHSGHNLPFEETDKFIKALRAIKSVMSSEAKHLPSCD